MARLPLQGSKMNKIKFGTTVEVATPDRIKELRSKNPESIRSTGEAIDYLGVLLTGLTPRVAEAMDKACQKEIQLAAQELIHLSSDGSEELSVAELERDYDQFLRLHEHFSLYYMDVAENEPRDMRRIDLADNDFAVVPSSWILLGDGDGSESFSQVSVVEISGGAKHGAPHFAFLHNGEYNEEDVLDLAIQKWPPLFDLAHDPCVGRWNSKSAKSCVYNGVPVICFHELQDASFYEGRGLDAPCGAAVHRCQQ